MQPSYLINRGMQATYLAWFPRLASLLDAGRQVRWVSKGTPEHIWVDSFARFLFTLRIRQKTEHQRNLRNSSKSKTLQTAKPGNRRKAS